MQIPRTIAVILGLWVIVCSSCYAQTAADEKGLWAIWQSQTNTPDDHLTIIGACQEFKAKSPKDPLVTVVHGLEAWHLLKAGKTNEAVKILEPMIPLAGDHLQKAGSDIACAWLSRIDREQVKLALNKVYYKTIEFPLSLTAVKSVKGMPAPPMVDRWGQSWFYQVEDVGKLAKQSYTLQSKRIGADSDLAKALKIPYAERINLTPVRIMSASADKVMIEFMLPTQKSVFLQAGTASEGIVVAYVGAKILVLSDGSHWRITAKPR